MSEIYERLGMDLPTAFRMFMAKSKMVKGLPFEARLPENTITRVEAKNAFYEMRKEVAMEKREDDAYLLTGKQKHYPIRDFIVSPAEMIAIIESI